MARSYESLRAGYETQLAQMVVLRTDAVDQTAKRLLGCYNSGRYGNTPTLTGIPLPWMAASFEREAGSDFRCSPAQGDPWNRPSVNVPAGRGPFSSWGAAALDAYHLDGLDKVGAPNWSWALCCYYGELFNGFGYRSKGIPSPYLWGGTTIQRRGKYVRDGVYDGTVMDTQLGIIPIMKRMVELDPTLQIGVPGQAPTPVVPPPSLRPPPLPKPVVHPAAPPIVLGAGALMIWLQDHWSLLALIVIGAGVALWWLHRQGAASLSPKALEPLQPPPKAAIPPPPSQGQLP